MQYSENDSITALALETRRQIAAMVDGERRRKAARPRLPAIVHARPALATSTMRVKRHH